MEERNAATMTLKEDDKLHLKTSYHLNLSLKDLGTSPLVRQIIVATGPIFITIVLGMTEGYSAILLPQLQHENSTIKIDTKLSSLIASMSALPMAGGAILGGYLMEKIGRRAIHIWSCVPLVLGWAIIATAPNSDFILTGRFLTGLSDGLLGPPIGVYIAETSHPRVRGVLIISTCVAVTFGLLLVHLLGTFFTWRLTALICSVSTIPFALLMLFVPESPTYLAKMKKIEEAKVAFYWCRGKSSESQKELNELIERQEHLNNAPKMSLAQHMRDLLEPEFWKPTLIMSVLFFTAQITGNNAIASYTIQIMRECGLSGEMFDEYLAMVTMDCFRLMASIISCFLINRMSRRSLTKLGGFGVTLALVCLCSYLYITPKVGFKSSIILLAIFVVYVIFMSVGLLPLSWTMMGEIFPLAHRGLGTGVTNLVCFIFLYLVVYSFPYLLEFFGDIIGVFGFYGACTLFGTIILVLYLPETKDKPLYVIEDNFKSKQIQEVISEG